MSRRRRYRAGLGHTSPLDAAPLERDASTEVCVVGLGGGGLAAIRRLHERGVDVIGVDAGRIGGGASGRNGGFPRPVYQRWGFEYHQQLPDGRVVLGGFRDEGGDAEWTDDAAPSTRVQALLEDHLRGQLGVHAPITHRWAGTIGFTHDGLPVVEEVRPGVFAGGGYSGTGNLVSRLAGRALADQVVDGRSELATLLAG